MRSRDSVSYLYTSEYQKLEKGSEGWRLVEVDAYGAFNQTPKILQTVCCLTLRS